MEQYLQQETVSYITQLKVLKKTTKWRLYCIIFYDFKVFEIAEMLGKPNNIIKMHLHRGRKAIGCTEKTSGMRMEFA